MFPAFACGVVTGPTFGFAGPIGGGPPGGGGAPGGEPGGEPGAPPAPGNFERRDEMSGIEM